MQITELEAAKFQLIGQIFDAFTACRAARARAIDIQGDSEAVRDLEKLVKDLGMAFAIACEDIAVTAGVTTQSKSGVVGGAISDALDDTIGAELVHQRYRIEQEIEV